MTDTSNPYVTGTKPELLPSVVAFIDILGYREHISDAVKKQTQQQLLERLHSTFRTSIHHMRGEDENGKPYYPIDKGIKDRCKIRTFSDNVLIGYPISGRGDGESELGAIFSDLSHFQLEMVNAGFFLRGAITVGDLYMDEIMVYGGGLVEAYEAENKLAREPRIILTDSARVAVERHLGYYSNQRHAPQNRDLYKDADGYFFLNYLDTIMFFDDDDGASFFELVLSHKTAIEGRLAQYKSQPTVWSKYMWVANYHNFFCDQCGRYPIDGHIDDYKINLNDYQMTPVRIID